MPTYDVRMEPVERQAALSIRAEVLPHEIGPTLAELLPRVQAYIEKKGGKIAGAPFCRYHGFGDKLRIEAGMAVSPAMPGEGDIQASELPGGDAAVTTHMGPYEALPQAHAAVVSWSMANRRSADGGPYELYLTDPADEPDENKRRTRVVLPLKPA
jgi:effector-binding domain-containing protein